MKITEKICDLDPEHDIYLFKAFNTDRNMEGGVISDQVIFLDDFHELLKEDS